jgi:sugar lactone lactonase YvrE
MSPPRQVRAETLLEIGCTLGEGPLQHGAGDLYWVDIIEQLVYRWDRAGEPSAFSFDEPVSAVAETSDGGVLAATASGLVHLAPNDRRTLVASLPRAAGDLRMNDGKADPFNRFVGGTMGRPRPRGGAGSLWSFGDGPPRELLDGVTISNGLAWSSDRRTMYFVDSMTYRIDAFDYDGDTGLIGNRRPVVEMPAGSEVGPDGLCIDVDGGLWVAVWGGSAVHRYVDGVLDTVVEVPTPYVSCPTFAGPERAELVITTAAEPFESDPPPGAGDLYIADVGVTGPPSFVIDLTRWRS